MRRKVDTFKTIISLFLASVISIGSYATYLNIKNRKDLELDGLDEPEKIVSISNDELMDETLISEDTGVSVEYENYSPTIDVSALVPKINIDYIVNNINEIVDNVQNNIIVCKYGYLLNDTMVYNNMINMKEIGYIEEYQKVIIIKRGTDYSLVNYIDDSGNTMIGYVHTSSLGLLANKFVEIDLSLQVVRLYIDNELLLECKSISGKDSSPTYIGCFNVHTKESPSVLVGYNENFEITYEKYVEFWMAYNDQIGMHDASWRSDYEYEIPGYYHENGSGGCSNLKWEDAKIIYDNIEVDNYDTKENEGTIVLVHR